MKVDELTSIDLKTLMAGDDFMIERYRQIQNANSLLTSIIEGSGVPTFVSEKHTQYFDTATNKYYRNVDGGNTWVALN